MKIIVVRVLYIYVNVSIENTSKALTIRHTPLQFSCGSNYQKLLNNKKEKLFTLLVSIYNSLDFVLSVCRTPLFIKA